MRVSARTVFAALSLFTSRSFAQSSPPPLPSSAAPSISSAAPSSTAPSSTAPSAPIPVRASSLVQSVPVASSPPPLTADTVAAALPHLDASEHFTLDQALAAMRHGHPLLAAARASEQSAAFDVRSAGLWTNPQLSVNYTRAIVPAFAGAYDPVLGYTTVMLSQLIETANLPGARQDVAEYERRAMHAEYESTARGLGFDVQVAFVALVDAADRLAVYRETADRLENANRIVSARVSAGAVPHYDLSRIGIALAQARADVADAEADLIAARVNLDVAVGPDATTLRGLPEFDLYVSPTLPPLVDLLSSVGVTRPDLVATSTRVQESRAQIAVARRTMFQGVTLFGGLALGAYNPAQGTPAGLPPEVDVTVGVSFPLPVVDHGQGIIAAAQSRAVARGETLHAQVLAAAQRLDGAYREAARRRESLLEYIATGAANSAGMRREAEAGYREGRLQVLDLVDAYISVRDARLRIVQLAREARVAEIDMFRASGVTR